MDNDETKLQVSLSHVYLELARAVFQPTQAPQVTKGTAPDFPVLFGLMSVTILYSYLALESFINYHFCIVYRHATEAHKTCRQLRQLQPDYENVPLYNDFCKKYGGDSLGSLRLELKEKIKSVCSAHSIPQVYEEKPQLWQDFCDILKPARDFLVHAVPEPGIFEPHMQRILEETRAGKYVQIATDMIEYFYEQHDREPPSWLSENQLIQFQAVRPGRHDKNPKYQPKAYLENLCLPGETLQQW